MKLKEQRITRESFLLNESGMTVAGNVIENVAVLGPVSNNGKGRDYTKEYHESARPKYEGMSVVPNHLKKGETRDVLDTLGILEGLYTVDKADGPHTYAKRWVINPEHPRAKQVLWAAENQPGNFGLSHDVLAAGKVKANGRFRALECRTAYEVCLVGKPGTNKNLFEELEDNEEYKQFELNEESEQRIVDKVLKALETKDNQSKKGTEEMDYTEITLEDLISKRPDLIKAVAETKEVKQQRESDALELKELRQAKDELKEAEACRKLCTESSLPEKAQTQVFIESLVAAKTADKRAALIEDKKLGLNITTIKSKAKTAGQQTAKRTKEADKDADDSVEIGALKTMDDKELIEELSRPAF